MNLLIDSESLELLLTKKKDKIGHNSIDGIDTLFSGITFFISAMLADYSNAGENFGLLIKIVSLMLGILFSVRGVYMMIRSAQRKYGYEALHKDIKGLNQNTHPFSIIAIKDTFNEYPNRFLLYYDERWDCKLFINYRTKPSDEENEINIRERLSHELKIAPSKIVVTKRCERIQRKFSFSDQIEKCYEHTIYQVSIPFSDKLRQDKFVIDGKKYYWMTIADMQMDTSIQNKNLDVVGYVNEIIT